MRDSIIGIQVNQNMRKCLLHIGKFRQAVHVGYGRSCLYTGLAQMAAQIGQITLVKAQEQHPRPCMTFACFSPNRPRESLCRQIIDIGEAPMRAQWRVGCGMFHSAI